MGSIYKRAGHRHWQMQYKDANGRRIRESSGTTDKASANQLLVARERVIAQIKAGTRGVNDDQFAEFAKQPIQDWINAFEQSMRIEHGQNSGHVDDTKSKIEKVCTGLAYGSGLNSDWLARYTSTRQRDDKLSARTIQSYVVAMKAFSKWCVHTGRLATDPLTLVRAPSPAKDRRYKRRAISQEEWKWLRKVTENGPTRRKISGHERATLYELALVTGLRAKELDSLTRSTLVLEGPTKYLMLPSSSTKNNKPAEQLLTPRLIEKLQTHCQRKMPTVNIFGITDLNRLAIVIRADMAAARAEWLAEAKTVDEKNKRSASDFLKSPDSEGNVVDFHSMRHTCGAWLAKAGIHAKQIQKMMRHGSIKLTLDTYGHLFPEMQTQAMEALERATAG
jgi:integrase